MYKELSKPNSKINNPTGKWQKTRADRRLVEEGTRIAKKGVKKRSTALPTREVQTATTRWCPTHLWVQIRLKMVTAQGAGEDVEKLDLACRNVDGTAT